MLEHIEKHLPDLKKAITNNVLKNDKTVKSALSKGYNLLPFYVRALLKEETFVTFCFERRHLLFTENKKPSTKSSVVPGVKKAPKKALSAKNKK